MTRRPASCPTSGRRRPVERIAVSSRRPHRRLRGLLPPRVPAPYPPGCRRAAHAMLAGQDAPTPGSPFRRTPPIPRRRRARSAPASRCRQARDVRARRHPARCGVARPRRDHAGPRSAPVLEIGIEPTAARRRNGRSRCWSTRLGIVESGPRSASARLPRIPLSPTHDDRRARRAFAGYGSQPTRPRRGRTLGTHDVEERVHPTSIPRGVPLPQQSNTTPSRCAPGTARPW